MRSFILITLVLLTASASAQSLSVFNLDATNFPTMKAKFYAFDANGQQQNPSASEITVTEDGIARTVTNITCPPTAPPKALSSVLVMDVSGSMSSGSGGVANINLAKAAATTWIQGVPLGPSECAVASFDGANYLNQDYTTNRKKLLTAIGGLAPQGSTDYDQGLLLPMSSGLQIASLGKHQRVIIFLTDGLPNQQPQTAAIIAEANKQNCLIFAVTFGLPCPQCLKDISTATRAKWFENVVTQAQINEVYLEILQIAQSGAPPCEITWQSDVSCTGDNRIVQFTWFAQTSQLSYTVPATAIAQLQFSPVSLYIRSKPVGIKFDTTVTITAINAGFSVTNITSTNPSYDINPKSFSLNAGQSRTLTVSYIPPDSSYTWTRFDIANDRCAQTYYASASYPGHKATIPTLELISPNGGEIYLTGSDTLITWKGIPLTDTVKLEYSLDDGSSWNQITNKATGGKYAWHVPGAVSDRCLGRVTQVPSYFYDGWVKNIGVGDQYIYNYLNSNIAHDSYANIYVASWFRDTANFGSIGTGGFSDGIFLAKYHPDGNIEWIQSVGASSDFCKMCIDGKGDIYLLYTKNYGVSIAKYHPDGTQEWEKNVGKGVSEINGIAIDNKGNIAITGSFNTDLSSGTIFDTVTVNGFGKSNFFVAKFSNAGRLIWVRSGGVGRQGSPGVDLQTGSATGIIIDSNQNIYVTGRFYDTLDFGQYKIFAKYQYYSDVFLFKYDSDGNLQWAKRAGSGEADGANGITLDSYGNIFITGYFSGNNLDTADFGNFNLIGKAMYPDYPNAFVAKYQPDGNVEWAAQSNTDEAAGNAIAISPLGNIYATGWSEIGFNISSITVTNYNPDGTLKWIQTLDTGMGQDVTVDPNGSVFITGMYSGSARFGQDFLFSPSGYNFFVWKIADHTLQSDTSDAVFSIIKPLPLSIDMNLGKVFVQSDKDSVVQTFIRNGGTFPFRVDSIALSGSNASEFGIVSGIPPYTIPVGGSQRVEFRFAPKSAGVKNANIVIFTQGDTLTQTIQGEGIQPTIAVMGNIIDFGQVKLGGFKDTTIIVAIQNTGSMAVSFISSTQLGPDKTQFTIQSGGAPFTLTPGSSQTVTLRFNPRYIGRTSGRIGFDYGASSPAILSLFGQGLGGLVSIADDSGYAGDHKNIPMILEQVPVTSLQSVATNFSARVAYDNSMLNPDSGTIQKGSSFDTVTVLGSLAASNTLGFVHFQVLLGEHSISPVNIVDFHWLDGAGNPVDYDAETESGTFHLLYGCGDSSIQKFMLTGKVASITSVTPNPANGNVHINIHTTETGITHLAMMDLLGQRVTSICDGELNPGDHSFNFNTHDLPTGSYFLMMQTPTVRRIERVDVQR